MTIDDMFRVNLYRSPMSEVQADVKVSEKHQRKVVAEINDTQRKILELLSEDAHLSALRLAEQIGVADKTVEANIRKLKERGILVRHGSPKNGYWEVLR